MMCLPCESHPIRRGMNIRSSPRNSLGACGPVASAVVANDFQMTIKPPCSVAIDRPCALQYSYTSSALHTHTSHHPCGNPLSQDFLTQQPQSTQSVLQQLQTADANRCAPIHPRGSGLLALVAAPRYLRGGWQLAVPAQRPRSRCCSLPCWRSPMPPPRAPTRGTAPRSGRASARTPAAGPGTGSSATTPSRPARRPWATALGGSS